MQKWANGQVSTIEFTQIQATVMHGLSVGNEVLKQLHQEMSLDKVEKLMDQTREGVEYQRVSTFPLRIYTAD